jgi:aldehyde dehydrogenase (NAD+)
MHENSFTMDLEVLRRHFHSGATLPYRARRDALRTLKRALKDNEEALLATLQADMRKPRFEAYMAEIGQVHAELEHALRNLQAWMEPQGVPNNLSLWPATGAVYPRPLGVVLLIAPWNYPAVLALVPLIGAVAAGNCAVLKPSEEAPQTAQVLERIIGQAFAKEHVMVVHGIGSDVVPPLIDGFRFDHIFFTGSVPVGRSILAQAAKQLVPVTLELGGKSPAIVDRRVDLERAVRRIAWSKFFNAGQTCIATDYALVHTEVMGPFLEALAKQVATFYGTEPQRSPDFARLVNDKHFNRVKRYLSDGTVRVGGQHDAAERYIAPTVLTDVPLDSPVMHEEIFGPVLPVIPWNTVEEAEAIIRRNPTPLALYVFSKDRRVQRHFTERIAFGGGCINHCMLHFGDVHLPFGGVGNSGMGRYHGKASFDLFTHHQSIVQAGALPEPGVQYPPYTGWKEKVMRWVLR